MLAVSLIALGTGACTRVHPHLSLPDMAVGEPSFFPTIEALTASPIIGGNTVEVLLNGEEIFPAILDAIRSAERTITYAQYFYEEGPVSRDIAEALAERCRAGVGVNVLLDAFGTLGIPTEYVDVMRRSGCHVAFFRPLTSSVFHRANNRLHRRILVVDGRVGFTGGSGVSRKWMGNGRVENHWRDTDVKVEGPVVEYLQGAFAENWIEATGIVLGGEPYFPRPVQPRGQVYAQVIRSSPAGGSFAMYTTFMLALASARRSILITNPYFVLDEPMQQALTEARRRGARVVVLVPGAIDHNIVRQASRGQFGRMLRAGIEIWEYRAALLHSKTAVIDGVWSTIGSTNLDNRSFALNDELNLVVYSAAVGRRMERIFEEDLKYAKRVEYREWRRRGLKDRILEFLARPLRDLL
ncbi:MAG: cardiolipin synthase B [Candidatus Rokubacteria bacterium]|nr:cardiolipin synthase B [Candidatus Rokubacteria bacterium]